MLMARLRKSRIRAYSFFIKFLSIFSQFIHSVTKDILNTILYFNTMPKNMYFVALQLSYARYNLMRQQENKYRI
jgi:hypothetical protein